MPGVQYNFEIRGDIQNNVTSGATYTVGIDFTNGFIARFRDADETAVTTSDLSAVALAGNIITVSSPAYVLSVVTLNNNTIVKDAHGVLLFKGKITANSSDNLKISRLTVNSYVGINGANFPGVDWDRFSLYRVNQDGTETKLDDETSLSSSNVINFSGFTLDIPKGISNGVYIAVRGDVNPSPLGTTTKIRWGQTVSTDYVVKDSDNDTVFMSGTPPTTYGPIITVTGPGTFSLTIDKSETPLNNSMNVLAGGVRKLARLKVTATNEMAKIEDIFIQNTGTAGVDTLSSLYLYSDRDLTELLGTADMSSSKVAFFNDVDVNIPTTGITYLYLAGLIKPIDYSSSPSADATADAGTTIALKPLRNYNTLNSKVVGVVTGETLNVNGITESTANMATVMGAVVSNVTTAFANGTLSSGANKEIFSFKVTAPNSMNVASDGSPLGFKLATVTFTIATTTGVYAQNFSVERVSGAAGKIAAKYGNGASTVTNPLASTFTVDFRQTYGTMEDLIVRPGDTVVYKIYATVIVTGSSQSLQVSMQDVFDGNTLLYTHSTDGMDVTAVNPLIPRITDVTGGTLSN